MPFINLQDFSGISPRTGPANLAANQAQVARNAKLQSGELRPWRKPLETYTPDGGDTNTIYRLVNPSTGAGVWLEFAVDVNVVPGPVADTTEGRVYYTGDGVPKKTNWALATTSGAGSKPFPDSYLQMGVPAPVAAPTLSVAQPLTGVNITRAGAGYSSAPTVVFSSGTATATATINAAVSTIAVATAGSGYTSAPTVTITGANGSGATATAKLNAQVSTIGVVTGGSGYTSAPTVTITGADGSGATATATISGGIVTAVTVTNGGSGYTGVPVVSFSGGGATTQATATATISGTVASVTVTNGGSGYTGAPTVTFSGGGASTQATGTATVSGSIASITLTNAGSYGETLPTVTLTGGGSPTTTAVLEASVDPAETRSYVYTYVSTFGSVLEESAPSPPQTITCRADGSTVTVSGFSTAPTTASNYNITALRVYRTLGGTFTYVGQVAITPATGVAAGSFVDNIGSDDLIGVPLTSTYYTPPPSDLKGLVAMPNGILAGFRANEVWFCEPYLPHAWPSSYMMTVGATVVGLGVFGQTLVVCTDRNPFLITGSTPGAMTQEKLPIPEPCVSKRSIASDQYGVLYASPNGVVSIGQGVADVITRPLMTRDEWSTYTPSSMIGALYQNMYVVFYTAGGDSGALVLIRGDTPPMITLETRAKAVFVEPTTASLYIVDVTDNKIYQLDADPVNNLFYEWTSKLFILPSPTNFAVMQMHANWAYIGDTEQYNQTVAEITAQNEAIWASSSTLKGALGTQLLNAFALNGSMLIEQPTPADIRNVQAFVLANGVQIASAGFTSDEPVRLPADGKFYNYEVTLTGNAPMRAFRMATSIGELKQL